MSSERRPVRWLHALGIGRPRPDESAELEVEHHLAELTDRLAAEGMSAAQARAEAERHFGDRARYTAKMRRLEEASLRGGWWTAAVEVVRQSSASVARTARREPGFTAAVVVTLGLGIGANATMYGIIDRLLLKGPEHIVEPERVVRVHEQARGASGLLRPNPLTYPDYAQLRAHSAFEGIAAYSWAGPRTVRIGGDAERFDAAEAAAELFPLLGVTPALGRFYSLEEARPGAELTVVLGYEYWRSRFERDPAVLGKTVEINGRDHRIVGVAPYGFTGVDLKRVDAWLPFEATEAANGADLDDDWNCYCLTAVARLTEGASTESASVEAFSIVTNARQAAGVSMSNVHGMTLAPLVAARGPQAGSETRVARWLAGVSLVVVLIACANVANLLTARRVRRRKEVGVRLALGIGRRTVLIQALLESLILASCGGALALLIAEWGGAVIRSILLPDVFFPHSALSPRLVLFTMVAALCSGLVAGVAPAIQTGSSGVIHGLKEEAGGFTARSSRLRGTLTVLQASMTVVLLVGAGLFVRSLSAIWKTDLGLDVDQLVSVMLEIDQPLLRTVVADLDGGGTETAQFARLRELHEEAARRVQGLPGVLSAAATGSGLSSGYSTTLRAEGVDSIPRMPGGGPYQNNVTPNYFATVGLTLIRGRGILPSDVDGSERVTVLSELMAYTLWPAGDAVGRCLYVGRGATECTRVVGVVEDAARNGLRDDSFMAYYLPGAQAGRPYNAVYVRTSGSVDDIAARIASGLRAFAPEVRYVQSQTLRDYLDPQARSWTLGATMFTIFGLLALVVAAVGLYSVLAFDVAQRTREIGIRTALGARKGRLLRGVVTHGAGLGAIGVALGLGAAYVAGPYIQDLLFETSPRDPTVYAGVALVLLGVSVAASLVPALRATRVDPVTALKTD
ncbi:MAG: ADOP family duplicated permease [Gemmatimonadales bacterium]